MNFRTKSTAFATAALLAVGCLPASASIFGKKKVDESQFRKPSAVQDALINKAITREALVVKELQKRVPLVETYIQNMKPDPIVGQTPESDVHFLGRVNFGKEIGNTAYSTDPRDQKSGFGGVLHKSLGYVTGLSGALHLKYNEGGFVRLIVIDSNGPNGDGFDRAHYKFSFVRNDFLGTIPTAVFDVAPAKEAAGRFKGRIWIERNGGNIVRYIGDIEGEQVDQREFFHFDSWRTNVYGELWMPTSVYIEESDPKSPSHTLKMKAINHIWGYELKIPPKEAEDTNIDVVGANDQSQDAPDVSPLEAQRDWVQQAEDNVIERLYTAGIIDAPSPFDKTLGELANNILAYNKIQTAAPIRVRTMLTEPLESISIGNTILISKGLIDTTAVQSTDGAQQIANLYAVLAFQVAHVILGHHIDTKYAFSDRLMFPSQSAFVRLPMHHTDADNEAAAKKAVELLTTPDAATAPDMATAKKYFGLYLQQLVQRAHALKALNEPMLGDSLLRPDATTPWMNALISGAPKLNVNDLEQNAAAPLASFLNFDPWTDQVVQKHSTFQPLLSSRDKLPFEITPVYLKLRYWKPAPAPEAAPEATPAAAPAPEGATPAAAAPAAPDASAPPVAATPDAATPPAAPSSTTPQPATTDKPQR
jgi:hypothetical protein